MQYIPDSVPFNESFQLIYAFSVFTHLSQRTADAAMRAFRRGIAADGMLVITVRPEGYWEGRPKYKEIAARMEALHASGGFAFAPHDREGIDGEITYGDASMSLDYILNRWTDWRIVDSLINAEDPLQRLVFMVPV